MKKVLFFTLVAFIVPGLLSAKEKAGSPLPVIGAVETLTLVKEKLHFPARIDTGAQSSSLSAVGIQPFEHDGRAWLRFQVKDPSTGKMVEVKRPLEGKVKIKRHGAAAIERFVVLLRVTVGGLERKCKFNLVDRSDYKYPALIGRNFLNGKAVVDVSREYITHPLSEAGTDAN